MEEVGLKAGEGAPGPRNGSNTDQDVNESLIKPKMKSFMDKSERLKGEGSQTFTMTELLNELKEENGDGTNGGDFDGSRREAGSYLSQESSQQKQFSRNDSSMELINNIIGVDEEGRSRQKILTFAAKRYANAIERNPDNHDAYYNWALVLQESADTIGSDSGSSSKDALLEEACKKYDEATRLCPTLYDAFYNWAIAISDRAKIRGRTKEAEELWKQVAETWESLDGWLDAIRLIYTIFARGKSDVLAGVLSG